MNRRSFLGALAAVFAAPLAVLRPKPTVADPLAGFKYWLDRYPAANEPSFVTGKATERIRKGDLVVWEYPASPIRIRRCTGPEDFHDHAYRGNAGVATKDQYAGGTMTAQTSGQMLVRAT